MGIFSEYMDKRMSFEDIAEERRYQLKRISKCRGGRDILVIAADVMKRQAPIMIDYDDLLPVIDQLDNLKGKAIDVILETPGGYAETGEDIVKEIRRRYESVGFIVPGVAKSAGTIMVMAGDEILMSHTSSLGPIDAQVMYRGSKVSAHALLRGFEKVKEDVAQTGILNNAHRPILSQMCIGDVESWENASKLAKEMVSDWLARYKFKFWTTHSTTGQPVTDEEKKKRAEEIAAQLCDHYRWRTHARSIKLQDLRELRLRVVDLSEDSELEDAIKRYYTLLRMTFDMTAIYKLFETTTSQIYRFFSSGPPKPPAGSKRLTSMEIEFQCESGSLPWKLSFNVGSVVHANYCKPILTRRN